MEIPSFLQGFQNAAPQGQAAQKKPAFDLNTLPAREVTNTYKQANSDTAKSSDDRPSKPLLALPSAPPLFTNRGQLLDVVV